MRPRSGRALPPAPHRSPAPAPVALAAALAFAAVPSTAHAKLTGAWTHEGGDNEAIYGQSVHAAGDVNGDGFGDVIIGAPGVSSQHSWAYVHHGSASGLGPAPAWSRTSGTNDRFGAHVATAGDVNDDGYDDVVICTTSYSNGQVGEGRVDLFLGGAGGLASTPAWSFETNEPMANLAAAAYAGDVNDDGFDDIVIGAPGVQGQRGRAWVYAGNASGVPTFAWSLLGSFMNGLGSDVGAAGDVNADGYDDFLVGSALDGYASVVLGHPLGPGTILGFFAPTTVPDSRFGASVSTAGDANGDGYSDFLVGAPWDSTDQWHEGRAYLYLGNASGFNTTPAWSTESNVLDGELGASVACAGDVNGDGYGDALLAAPNVTNPTNHEGRVLAYYGTALGLESTPFWVAEGEASPALLGRGLGTAGDVNGDGYADVIAGAPAWEEGGFFDEGRVAVWHGGPDAPGYVQYVTEGNQISARYGSALALGDFDADGYDDRVVGAGFFDVGGVPDAGQVWIYPGRPGTPSLVASHTLTSNPRRDRFGHAVDNAHDVNGDGYDDLLVGAIDALLPGGDVGGAAHVFLGGPGGVGSAPDWTTFGEAPFAQYGGAVSWAGDVNGDGYSDVLVGAPNHANGEAGEGKAYVFLGGPAGPGATPVWTWEPNDDGAQCGYDVAALGDINRDGLGDIIVGAPGFVPRGGGAEGAAFVFLGTPGGVSAVPVWDVLGAAGSELGAAVGSGDFNGDGFSDAIVGAPGFDQGGFANRGLVQIHASDGNSLGAAAWISASGPSTGARFGTVVAAADFDRDGTDEAVTSQPYVANGQTEEGQVLVYRTTPWAFFWGADGNAPLAWHGLAAASRGDVNGDGFPDLVTGSPGHEAPLVQEGVAHVWLGNAGGSTQQTLSPGLDRRGRLALADESRAIALLGVGDGTDQVRVRSHGRSALGRDDVALEVEMKPYGVPFDGQGTFVSPFADTGVPVGAGSWTAIAQTASGLGLTERYRWRARHVSAHPYAAAPWFGDTGNAGGEFDFRPGGAIVAAPEPAAASALALAVRPVPFRTSTTIAFSTAQAGPVDVRVVDVAGRRVAAIFAGRRPAGAHELRWDGADATGRPAAAGVYFAVVDADGRRESRRLVLLR